MDDYFDFIDVIEQQLENEQMDRLPKRYLRDLPSSFEFYSDSEFKQRYRFRKNTVRYILLPLVADGYVDHNNRGLPVPPINQLFTALTFFATGEFQVMYLPHMYAYITLLFFTACCWRYISPKSRVYFEHNKKGDY